MLTGGGIYLLGGGVFTFVFFLYNLRFSRTLTPLEPSQRRFDMPNSRRLHRRSSKATGRRLRTRRGGGGVKNTPKITYRRARKYQLGGTLGFGYLMDNFTKPGIESFTEGTKSTGNVYHTLVLRANITYKTVTNGRRKIKLESYATEGKGFAQIFNSFNNPKDFFYIRNIQNEDETYTVNGTGGERLVIYKDPEINTTIDRFCNDII